MTSFIIEHQCPQCGAPAVLEETDRLFSCEFCRVRSYLTTTGFFRYILPHRAPAGQALIYFPYWRFKGMLFSCLTRKIANRFVDASQQAIASMHFPVSVGFRSQTQKLRFAATEGDGTFLKPHTTAGQFLESLTAQYSANLPKPILHQAQIGETLSLLYAPFYLKDQIIDGILNEPVGVGSAEQAMPLMQNRETNRGRLAFIPALCPQCGWDLKGDRDSLALNCTNCHSTWWAKKDRFEAIKVAHAPDKTDDPIYMPFWRIKADVSSIDLNSYADLIKTANLPRVVQAGWDQRTFYFWSPAFKVRPQSLLTFATNVTLNQPLDRLVAGQPKGRIQGVNMPLIEAAESLKLILAGFMKPRERMVEKIQDIEIKARRFLLVYLPFRQGHHELVHDGLRLAINKNLLVHSKNL